MMKQFASAGDFELQTENFDSDSFVIDKSTTTKTTIS